MVTCWGADGVDEDAEPCITTLLIGNVRTFGNNERRHSHYNFPRSDLEGPQENSKFCRRPGVGGQSCKSRKNYIVGGVKPIDLGGPYDILRTKANKEHRGQLMLVGQECCLRIFSTVECTPSQTHPENPMKLGRNEGNFDRGCEISCNCDKATIVFFL